MTSASSKALPFIFIGIAAIFLSIDMFTPYELTDNMVSVIITLLPVGVGGLVNKGWETYKAIKLKKEE